VVSGKIDCMVRVAICDDEEPVIAGLGRDLGDVFDDLGVEHEIDGFSSGEGLCRSLEAGVRYDLIFLDVSFAQDEMTGVEAGQRIRETLCGDDAYLVYISKLKRHAYDLIKIHPMEFLIKPLTRDMIETAAAEFLKATESRRDEAMFLYGKGRVVRQTRIRDISYLEARGRKVILHLGCGESDEYYGALKDAWEEQLKGRNFIFIHASYIVNSDYMTEIGSSGVRMRGRADPLPVSQNRRTEAQSQYERIMARRF